LFVRIPTEEVIPIKRNSIQPNLIQSVSRLDRHRGTKDTSKNLLLVTIEGTADVEFLS